MRTTDLDHCRQLLNEGELVAIPTETVYGLAANIHDVNAVQKIFETKGRPRYNPLIVHIHDVGQLMELTKAIPEAAMKLAKQFWPGPLTLILPKSDRVSDLITAGKKTVGIRMPNHSLTHELLKGLDFPLAAPSANPFTRVSPTSAQHVADYFGDAITVLDGGPCQVGLESTIVGIENGLPVIYRKGGISIEAIENCVGSVKLVLKSKAAPVAPGMLDKHYAPKTKLVLTDDIEKAMVSNTQKRIGVLSFFKAAFPKATKVCVLSKDKSLDEAAHNLFEALHELDTANLDVIVAERFPNKGLGVSINDRLERAEN